MPGIGKGTAYEYFRSKEEIIIQALFYDVGQRIGKIRRLLRQYTNTKDRGRNVKSAMKEGFRKAMSAIVDGNITTLIAAAVLYLFGSGSVRGFAQTLALGIVLSMFTALVITRGGG